MERGFWTRVVFGIAALLIGVWVACAWLNPVSNNHYNPSKTYNSQQRTHADFVPPPSIDPKSGQTEQTTDKEIEKWRASRSGLAAQWKASDMSQLTFRIGVLGVILLTWTIVETLGAGKELRRQNEIALKATKAEFQPYIDVDSLVLSFPENWDREIFSDGNDVVKRAMFLEQHGRVHFPFEVTFSNWGKTPAQNFRFEIAFTVYDFDTNKVLYEGGEIDPTIDLVDYLTALDGKKEFFFTSYSQYEGVGSADEVYVDLVIKPIEVCLSVFFEDQFSDRDREYIFKFEGYCSHGKLLKKSVKEIEKT